MPTPHREMLAGGIQVWSMCAIYALGIPGTPSQGVVISSVVPVTCGKSPSPPRTGDWCGNRTRCSCSSAAGDENALQAGERAGVDGISRTGRGDQLGTTRGARWCTTGPFMHNLRPH
ncbi:organomercurial lyase [Streptomyces sp. APSN-46.1]|uniref:organomercurial lyase n=1 Tax=Streptomyces sp. APSN-46.1 TaxID=2929049 RepID=UPI0035ABFD16